MLVAENRMPIVGRMKDFDVAGGWTGIGIVAGYSAAQAYADWVVNGNDEKLKLFESMQPGFFQPEPSFNFMPVITAPRPDDAVA
jgi:glycine/D-amino acid oxidase-like deaminating enzyme